MNERLALSAMASDTVAMAARREVARELSEAFADVGSRLRLEGHLIGDGRVSGASPFGNGDDRRVAVGYLCELAASLLGGASALVEVSNPYAAAALVRQLVEVEYLLWAFAADHDDASTWLATTNAERRNFWQPKHLRERAKGHFRSEDYWRHCNIGGHPTPEGARFLINDTDGVASELVLHESIVHSTGAWGSVRSFGDSDSMTHVDDLIEEWRASDHLGEGVGP